MSSPAFNINKYYQQRLPRGENLPPVEGFWDGSGNDPVEVDPAISPENYVVFVKELWFYDNSIAFTEDVSGDGLIDITFPNAIGGAYVTWTITDMAEIYRFANRQETINSIKYNVIVFDPPALAFASKTANKVAVTINPNATYLSGDLAIIFKKAWTITESLY